MRALIKPADWFMLTDTFSLVGEEERNRETSYPMAALLEPAYLREVLEEAMAKTGYPSLKVLASTVIKRHSVVTASAGLYAASALNLEIDFSVENCYVDLNYKDGPWHAKMPLRDFRLMPLPDGEERPKAFEDLLRRLFAEHTAPFIEALRGAVRINPQILWENTAERVYALYERRLAKMPPAAAKRAAGDFAYILSADPDIFGTAYNPFARFNLFDENGVRMRKTCCLRYSLTDPEHYCANCPVAKKKGRH